MISEGWVHISDGPRAFRPDSWIHGTHSGPSFRGLSNLFRISTRVDMNGNWYPILPLFVRKLRYIYTPRGRGVIPSFRFYLAHWKKRENKNNGNKYQNNGKKGIGWASRKLMKGRGSSEDPDEIMIMKTMETSIKTTETTVQIRNISFRLETGQKLIRFYMSGTLKITGLCYANFPNAGLIHWIKGGEKICNYL